jgi:hypothetical protein
VPRLERGEEACGWCLPRGPLRMSSCARLSILFTGGPYFAPPPGPEADSKAKVNASEVMRSPPPDSITPFKATRSSCSPTTQVRTAHGGCYSTEPYRIKRAGVSSKIISQGTDGDFIVPDKRNTATGLRMFRSTKWVSLDIIGFFHERCYPMHQIHCTQNPASRKGGLG